MFKNLPIRRKIQLAIQAGIVLALLLSGLGLVTLEYFTFHQRATQMLTAQAEIVGSSIYAAVDFADNAAATKVLAALKSSPEIVSADLFNQTNQLLASYSRDSQFSNQPPAQLEDGEYFEHGHLILVHPLSHNKSVFARLRLQSDLSTAWQQFLQSITLLAIMFLLLAGVSLVLSNLLERTITQPLTELAKTTRAVREQKDYSLRAPIQSSDEIGQLADSFNSMLETVQQQNETLRKDEEFLDRLIESAGDAIFLSSLQGRLVRVNQQAVESLGYPVEQLLQMNVWDVDVTINNQNNFSKNVTALSSSSIITIDGLHRRADGATFPVETRISLMESATGKFVLGFARDVSDRKRAEAELRRLATAVEQSVEDIMITDATGRIEYVNPAFEKLTGYSRTEAIGHNPRILKSGKQDAAFYKVLWTTILKGQIWRGRFINRRKDGQLLEEEATISPIVDAQGKLLGYVSVKRDVTEQIKLESQLRHAQKMEAVGQLAGGIAHDFNNILTVIMGHAELLKLQIPTHSPLADSLHELATSAERARDLTRQLLAYSRRQIMQMRLLNLNDVVHNLGRMLRRLIGEHITLECSFAAALPLVRADAGMLEQVLTNLTVNARDAMPRGGQLRLSTHMVQLTQEDIRNNPETRVGQFVCLEIQDNGCGMDDTTLRRIFEPFFTTKDVGKGTGLGLAMVYGIVKQHEGWAEVASSLGKGTTFKIFLPASSQTQIETQTTAPQLQMTGGTQTILVVEDEPAVLRLVCETLNRYGYRVKEATNANEALQVWETSQLPFDLLITDMIMPGGMTGLELARQLLIKNSKLKVICCSGYSLELQQEEKQNSGFAFLAKPYRPAALLTMVRDTLAGVPQ
jgi:PAS domain S-box-containing protein